MAQRSIRSFFALKPSGNKTEDKEKEKNGAESLTKKCSESPKSEDALECKENIPRSENRSQPSEQLEPVKQPELVKERDLVQPPPARSGEDLPESDLNLSVPFRKTARKSLKRKSEVEQLQEEKAKKVKSLKEERTEKGKIDEKFDANVNKDSSSTTNSSQKEAYTGSKPSLKKNATPKSKKSPQSKESKQIEAKKATSPIRDPSPESMDTEDSPIKIKSKRNRILSDSEDEGMPAKSTQESPAKDNKNDNKHSKSFSIFNVKKSPTKTEKEKYPDKSEKKKSPIKSENKKSPLKTEKGNSPIKTDKDNSPVKSEKDRSPVKTEKDRSPVKSEKSPDWKQPQAPVVEEQSPKPSTSKGLSNQTPKPKTPFQGFFSPKQNASGKEGEGKDYDKKVKKGQYNPVEDCFWKQGDKTPYLGLANTLLAIEETSGRLRTIEILSNYFRSVMVQTPEDLLPSIYMTLNRLAPAWEGMELGIGETLLIKAIANSTGRSSQQIKADVVKYGDVGIVAENSKGSQRTMFQPAPLTVPAVFARLREIAAMTGNASTTKKIEKIQSLLVACRGSEARYLIRSLAGKLRIGLAEQSVLQALAQACLQTPLGQEYPPKIHTAFKSAEAEHFKERLAAEAFKLKTAYSECPSYDILVPVLLDSGVDGLRDKCRLIPGIPLKPMLAHPTKGVQEVLTRFEDCQFTCEWKYDGERAQVHLHPDGKIHIYSRNQEDNTSKFPDIIKRFPECLNAGVESAILDCEAVAWDREKRSIQPFQVLSTRKRKDAVESEIKVQVCLFGFDLLYLNGQSQVKKPFLERRNLLRDHFKVVEGEFHFAKGIDGTSSEEIQEALEESIKDNCEGLMVKTLDKDATYEIARRSRNWLKLKKDYLDGVGDTMDLVVIGGYLGKGKRTGGYGGFLLACYDQENEEYQTICKIGTGFTDEDLQKHAAFFKEHVIEKAKGYYSYDQSHVPDHWFEPVQVWEVKCADLSVSPVHKAALGRVDPAKGVSLRFPRFIRIREDKSTEDATSSEQIAEMYNNQDQIKNNNKTKPAPTDDDFDF